MENETSNTDRAFPVPIEQACILIAGNPTDIVVLGFSNRIVVLVTQLDNIGSLLMTQLASSAENPMISAPMHNSDGSKDLAESSVPIDTRFILGTPGDPALGMIYQLLATQITNTIYQANRYDGRQLLLGISLKDHRTLTQRNDTTSGNQLRETLGPLVEAIKQCRVW
ncbi:hypothetical protein BJ085DRAFT_37890 [Dimargaris cristalligena]|uniref:Uncharacterized protein n=1 Tax=Dimargaris cristalligena TaxID=215637 RepID=A0A4P9ZXI6_9FUNG|nr:hypothetical protein BJ085DRAFT_37890 [Dimargaris cristalligena]|eukprot:RKP38384.1 hypothetical protein BJ085DRAFT_37890 [Dimargaris cristalligena]